jgi:hypothetical protein
MAHRMTVVRGGAATRELAPSTRLEAVYDTFPLDRLVESRCRKA